MYYWWDPTYILVVIGAIICLIASARVKTTYAKYSKYRSMSGLTGAQAAERILHDAGIYDVQVGHFRKPDRPLQSKDQGVKPFRQCLWKHFCSSDRCGST